MNLITYNQIFELALQTFISDYISGIYSPTTESDINYYLMALCKELLQKNNLPLNLHAHYTIPNNNACSGKKVDIVLNSSVAVEIKFEANYPGVSKPVVFPKEAAKDIERLTLLKQSGIDHCHFVFLDEDGTHMRNFNKYTSVALSWQKLNPTNPSYLLHLTI